MGFRKENRDVPVNYVPWTRWAKSFISDAVMFALLGMLLHGDTPHWLTSLVLVVFWLHTLLLSVIGLQFAIPLNTVCRILDPREQARYARMLATLGNRCPKWRAYDNTTDALYIGLLWWTGFLTTAVAFGIASWFCKTRACSRLDEVLRIASNSR